ncbi:MAG: MCP four helix bundle domain-containing protein, partial [Spirochaetales bacterium]|nr:MCP four helix bundle domain-containing protein [Spirochaetales bacterium]
MKMRSKITLGFVLVIIPFLVAVVWGVVSLQEASEGFTEYRELARDTNLAGRLQANMLMVRMSAKDFIISTSDDAHEAFEEHFTAMEGFMQEAQQSIENTERAKLIDEADERVTEYGEYFDKVFEESHAILDLQTQELDVAGP